MTPVHWMPVWDPFPEGQAPRIRSQWDTCYEWVYRNLCTAARHRNNVPYSSPTLQVNCAHYIFWQSWVRMLLKSELNFVHNCSWSQKNIHDTPTAELIHKLLMIWCIYHCKICTRNPLLMLRCEETHIEGNIDRVPTARAFSDVSYMASSRKEAVAFVEATLHSTNGTYYCWRGALAMMTKIVIF